HAEQREAEPDEAGELERAAAEARGHVHGVGHQAPKAIVRAALRPRIVTDPDDAEARGPPAQEDVDRDIGSPEALEGIAKLGSKDAKRAHLLRDLGAHRALEGELRDPGRDSAEQSVARMRRRSVHDVELMPSEVSDELRDLL